MVTTREVDVDYGSKFITYHCECPRCKSYCYVRVSPRDPRVVRFKDFCDHLLEMYLHYGYAAYVDDVEGNALNAMSGPDFVVDDDDAEEGNYLDHGSNI